jgi:multidrug resistance efflux pump
MALATIAVLGGGAYFFYVSGGRYQSTDDTYAQAATVAISANAAGRVSEIEVRDKELVRRGATLFKLDDAPFRIAVSDAAAHLADSRLRSSRLNRPMPPENATGNWVKIVQRVPVRLQLADVDAGFLLQAGLSADVTVDTHSRDGKLTAATPPASAGTVSR